MTQASVSERLHGYLFEELEVGMSAVVAKTVTEADIVLFAGLTGDMNPMHLNEEFASKTPFKGRICHGMLTASFISAVIGMKLPGPGCIYMSQTLRFTAPVRVGDTARAIGTIVELYPEKARARIRTEVKVGDRVVIDGEALVMVPRQADVVAEDKQRRANGGVGAGQAA